MVLGMMVAVAVVACWRSCDVCARREYFKVLLLIVMVLLVIAWDYWYGDDGVWR